MRIREEKHSGKTFYLKANDSMDIGRFYCGYVEFEKAPELQEDGYNGILIYVPVHGGITYAAKNSDTGTATYGFDCAHAGDSKNPLYFDEDWLIGECKRMALGIEMAVEFEAQYLEAEGDGWLGDRAKVIDAYHDKLKEEGISYNTDNASLAAMLGIIMGQL